MGGDVGLRRLPDVRKLLVANRGEIACRVIRTARTMGIATVAVYSDADAGAPHAALADEAVRIGSARSADSYLSIERVLEAARRTGADTVHPGYGFLSENADFAQACADTGLVFVGPPAHVIRTMGSKIAAKEIMAAAGVPTVPGGATPEKVGFPLLVKAAAGGGGKGMRIVRGPVEFEEALGAARREAAGAFGDDTLMLERYVEAPRHIVVQIFGDLHGHVIHLHERVCSIQRRHQKIIEEAPSPIVSEELRARMGAAAVAAGRAIGYVGAGTVEFLYEEAADAFYFLEVNTRLQVEHPVTELTTGLDLVRLQLLVAQGEPLPEASPAIVGHAIEARLYAEDPVADFLPSTGRVALWEEPALEGVRIDAGLREGSEIGVNYDPLLAKMIAYGADREEARRRLVYALRDLRVAGPTTNREYLVTVLEHPDFVAGRLDTHFTDRVQRTPEPDPARVRAHSVAAALHGHEQRNRRPGPLPVNVLSGWSNNRSRPQDVAYGETVVNYEARAADRFDVDGEEAVVHAADERTIDLELAGVRRRYTIVVDGRTTYVQSALGSSELIETPRFAIHSREEAAGGYLAPMSGVVQHVRVTAGERVEKGQLLLVLEAMKMEHRIVAQDNGVVADLRVEPGQLVDPDYVLLVLEAD